MRAFAGGRAFLLGDAAHVHRPLGGRGTNTGIGDAVKLAWKLAAILDDGGAETLLDTYEPERIAFAPSRAVFGRSSRVRSRRSHISAASVGSPSRSRNSPSPIAGAPACGVAGRIRAGDRLPWVVLDPKTGADDHAPLASRRWQVHAYGSVSRHVRTACAGSGIALHVFPWRFAFRRVGLVRGTSFVVRPDGYIGCAGRDRCGAEIGRDLQARVPDARTSAREPVRTASRAVARETPLPEAQ